MNDNTAKTPLVSFIITYHDEPVQWLRECLHSIFALSLPDDEREIILIDDGSELCPLDRIYEQRDAITYLRQRNMGLGVARNTGLTIATGRYIQFIDADDTLIPTGYEHCLDIVRFKQPDVVTFQFSTTEGGVDTPYLFDGPVSGTEYIHNNNLRAAVWGYVFRRGILNSLRFTPGIVHEDEEFTPQLFLRAESVYSTDTSAYYYRQHANSIVHNTGRRAMVKRFADAETIICHLNHLAQTLPVAERTALSRRVAQLTMDHLYNIIMQTQSAHQLETRIARLEKQGLFPLPEKGYTAKYRLFSKLVRTKTGRRTLLALLPRLKK